MHCCRPVCNTCCSRSSLPLSITRSWPKKLLLWRSTTCPCSCRPLCTSRCSSPCCSSSCPRLLRLFRCCCPQLSWWISLCRILRIPLRTLWLPLLQEMNISMIMVSIWIGLFLHTGELAQLWIS